MNKEILYIFPILKILFYFHKYLLTFLYNYTILIVKHINY